MSPIKAYFPSSVDVGRYKLTRNDGGGNKAESVTVVVQSKKCRSLTIAWANSHWVDRLSIMCQSTLLPGVSLNHWTIVSCCSCTPSPSALGKPTFYFIVLFHACFLKEKSNTMKSTCLLFTSNPMYFFLLFLLFYYFF